MSLTITPIKQSPKERLVLPQGYSDQLLAYLSQYEPRHLLTPKEFNFGLAVLGLIDTKAELALTNRVLHACFTCLAGGRAGVPLFSFTSFIGSAERGDVTLPLEEQLQYFYCALRHRRCLTRQQYNREVISLFRKQDRKQASQMLATYLPRSVQLLVRSRQLSRPAAKTSKFDRTKEEIELERNRDEYTFAPQLKGSQTVVKKRTDIDRAELIHLLRNKVRVEPAKKQASSRKRKTEQKAESRLEDMPSLVVEVMIDDNRKEELRLFRDDDVKAVAEQFGRKHGLGRGLQQKLMALLEHEQRNLLAKIQEVDEEEPFFG